MNKPLGKRCSDSGKNPQQAVLERLARVAKETMNAVVVTDLDGRVEWVNESFTRITGYTLADMLGRKPGEVLQGPDTEPDAVKEMHEAIQQHRSFEAKVVNYTKSGKAFFMHVTCDALRDATGRAEGFIAIETDITPQKEAEDRVHHLLAQLEKLTSNIPGVIYQFQLFPDGRSCLPYVSKGLTAFKDLYVPGIEKDASPAMRMIHPDDKLRVIASIRRSAETLTVWHEQFQIKYPTGDVRWVEGRSTPERLKDGSTLWHGFLADISKQKRLQQEQLEQAMHTQAILDHVVDGIVTVDSDGFILSSNHAVKKMFGYRHEQLCRRGIHTLLPEIYHKLRGKGFHEDSAWLCGEGAREILAVRRSGDEFPVEVAFSKIYRDGKPVFIGVIRDISERKDAERKIHTLAFYDSLTKIPNRRLFYDRLAHARAISKRLHSYGALLFIDLDNFKRLNDTAGHDTGDRLLQIVAQRLLHCVRDNDTVARLGGDEFMVLLEDIGSELDDAVAHAELVGEKIRQSLEEPYPEVGYKYSGSSSIGITLFSDNEEPVEEVLKQVDMAMYQAKAAGRNRIAFFDPYMQDAAMAYATMENELRHAFQLQQFELFYQVQVNALGEPMGAEALLRWRHPVNGWVRPTHFIPLAEETRLIVPIGRWVLEAACRQAVAWAAQPQTRHLTLAINVSAMQINEPDFVEQVLAVVERSGVDPRRLKLELTETSLASDSETIIAKMILLREKGLRFALDDFGTGYSSLSYLKRMPIEQLKIDQSFIRDILTDSNDMIIAKSIIALAESMEMSVVAEGVESEAHRQVLIDEGCMIHQGYFYGRPLPARDFERSLNLN